VMLTFVLLGLGMAADDKATIKWQRAHATFYGGADASGKAN